MSAVFLQNDSNVLYDGDSLYPLDYINGVVAVNNRCARFKQKQWLGSICDFEIQAYLGHHWPFICHLRKKWSMGGIFSTHFFCGIFIVHLLYQGMRLETLKWAYLKSCILDNITGNKRFRSHFQLEWLEIYRIHCSICIQWKNGKKSKFPNTPKSLLLLGGSTDDVLE